MTLGAVLRRALVVPGHEVGDDGADLTRGEPPGGVWLAKAGRYPQPRTPARASVTRDPQQLTDERRYDAPVTVISTESTSEMLCSWIEQGERPVREFRKIRDVDLSTGHWPQFTRPEELGRAILRSTMARR